MKSTLIASALLLLSLGCAHSSDIGGSQESSKPANQKEEVLYKQALLRCYKTGGSRIVKIKGDLLCF